MGFINKSYFKIIVLFTPILFTTSTYGKQYVIQSKDNKLNIKIPCCIYVLGVTKIEQYILIISSQDNGEIIQPRGVTNNQKDILGSIHNNFPSF